MDNEKAIRWKQRFANYQKAFAQLSKFVKKNDLNELEEQGIIKVFEYTYELAWNVMKDYYEYQGEKDIQGSRDAIRLAFKRGLIADREGWMAMITSRIKSSHTYNEKVARQITADIKNKYYDLFAEFDYQMSLL